MEDAVEAFLLSKQVAGCTSRTLQTYRWWLDRFIVAVPEPTAITVRAFFVRLQE